MPGLGPLLDAESRDETAKLWLPSDLSKEERLEWCLPSIPVLEFRFRYAQADDSLAEIRRLRRMLQGLHDQNLKHPSLVQKSVTRTKGLFESFRAKIRRVVSRYRDAREAMMALDPSQQLSPGWMNRFQQLEDAHVRGPGCEPDDTSNGKFIPSWIWLVPRLTANAITPGGSVTTADPQGSDVSGSDVTPADGSPGSDATNPSGSDVTPANDSPGSEITTATDSPTIAAADDPKVAESMRVHWAKCQAQADRYEEEVTLTVEEMGRTLRYFEWKKTSWLSLQSVREESSKPPAIEVCRGLRAYACRQAHVYETLVASFVKRWRKVLEPHKLGETWLQQYPAPDDSPPAKKQRVQCSPMTPEPIPSSAGGPSQADPVSSSLPPPVLGDDTIDPPMDTRTESNGSDDDSYYDDDSDYYDYDYDNNNNDDWVDEDGLFDFDD